MTQSTPSTRFEVDVAKSLARLRSGDSAEMLLRQRHPLARYRDPHPVFELSCSLLSWALNIEATGLKIVPSFKTVAIHFETNGEIKETAELPKELLEPLSARFKDMANVNVSVQNCEQAGNIPMHWQQQDNIENPTPKTNTPANFGGSVCFTIFAF